MVTIIIGGLLMTDAPEVNQTLNSSTRPSNEVNTREYSLSETIKMPQFWILAITFFSICMSGLYVIGVAKDIGENYVHLSTAAAATSVAVIAVANLSGRLVLGVLSDKIERIKVISFAILVSFVGVTSLVFAAPSNNLFILR